MPEKNGSRWQVGFWILTGFIGILVSIMIFMGNAVIANDRQNTDEHNRMQILNNAELKEIRASIYLALVDIKTKITGIETTINNDYGKTKK